ncbi:hypothetical protein BH11MYX4_BH11MYX4_38680 [soil metagenome]
MQDLTVSEPAPTDGAVDPLSEARAALHRAIEVLARARGGPAETMACRGSTGKRWLVVDRFERDGRRFVVVQEGATAAAVLSEREDAVLAACAAGHHDKLIAFDLGLAPSTVRVLVFRAVRKLGASSRTEAIVRYRAGAGSRA